MAERRFALPDIQDLSKEQERVRRLPDDGCHLIVGGPGTGKSVIALLRARQHHRDLARSPSGAQDYVFLAYNKLLIAASRELMHGEVHAQTWLSWFKSVYRSALHAPCPTMGGQAFALDWHAINQGIVGVGDLSDPVPPYLIIDEGQDMPPSFYQALWELGFQHFFVVADQNQRIYPEQHSTVAQIADALDLEPQQRIELRDNYRNNYPVARLALAFCVDDPASPCVQLPPARSAQIPVLVDYGEGARWSFTDLVTRILKAADRDPARLFGLITPDNQSRLRWLQALRAQPVPFDHGRPRIVTYATGEDQGDLRFGAGGIFVLNAQAAKGLEFDSVILADIHRYHCHPEDLQQMDDLRRRFYVLISRARERIVLLREAGSPCPADALLPTDAGILKRWGQA